MQKIEKKIINFIEKNIGWICIGAGTVIRLMICFYVRRYESGDVNADLLPWFVEWNGENKKEKFWKVHNAMYPEDMVKYADFDLNKFVKKLMKLNYDLNILNNLTMDEYVKSR